LRILFSRLPTKRKKPSAWLEIGKIGQHLFHRSGDLGGLVVVQKSPPRIALGKLEG
jgi:hypothetical protein